MELCSRPRNYSALRHFVLIKDKSSVVSTYSKYSYNTLHYYSAFRHFVIYNVVECRVGVCSPVNELESCHL